MRRGRPSALESAACATAARSARARWTVETVRHPGGLGLPEGDFVAIVATPHVRRGGVLRTGKKGLPERAENPSEVAGRDTRADPCDKGSISATSGGGGARLALACAQAPRGAAEIILEAAEEEQAGDHQLTPSTPAFEGARPSLSGAGDLFASKERVRNVAAVPGREPVAAACARADRRSPHSPVTWRSGGTPNPRCRGLLQTMQPRGLPR